MNFAIEVLEASKRELNKDLKAARAIVDIRVMFGEETSWIQEARENVSGLEDRLSEVDSAISRLRGDG